MGDKQRKSYFKIFLKCTEVVLIYKRLIKKASNKYNQYKIIMRNVDDVIEYQNEEQIILIYSHT